MKELFLDEAKDNKVFPIGAGIWLRLHPEDRVKTPYTSWVFDTSTTRMPEFTAPGLGRESNLVTIDAEVGANASGVLYALGGASGGLALYMDEGQLVYEYNMMIIERYTARSKDKIAPGRHKIEVSTKVAKPGAPAAVILKVDGDRSGNGRRQAHRARRFHRERDVRCRYRSGFACLTRLLRTSSIPLRRDDHERQRHTAVGFFQLGAR